MGPASLLHAAAQSGAADVAQLLLDAGAAVDHPRRSDGQTALRAAMQMGHDRVVAVLVAAGARAT